MEGTAVKIKSLNGREIIVLSLYSKPNSTLNIIDLNNISALIASNEAIIGADLNARNTEWGDNRTNQKGRVLKGWLDNEPNLFLRPTDSPTRCTSRSQTYIDIFMSTPSILSPVRPKNSQFN